MEEKPNTRSQNQTALAAHNLRTNINVNQVKLKELSCTLKHYLFCLYEQCLQNKAQLWVISTTDVVQP